MQKQEPIVEVITDKTRFDDLNWSGTSKWMFNRLQLGRKNADQLIADQKAVLISQLPSDEQLLLTENPTSMGARIIFKRLNEQAVDTIFNVAMEKDLRELQYIMNDKTIVTVASVKHNLIKPKEIRDAVHTVFENNGYNLTDMWKKYDGLLATEKRMKSPFGDLLVGLGASFGNFTLRRAIKIGVYFQIEVCTNPLTFLELSNTMGTRINLYQNRFLRIGATDNLLKKVEVGVNETVEAFRTDKVPSQMIKNGKAVMNITDASYVVNAMGNAYRIGDKLQNEILDEYRNTTKTTWNLAMIISQIARDEDNFRSNAVKTPAKLSAMSLVLLTTQEIRQVVRNSKDYCEKHNIKI